MNPAPRPHVRAVPDPSGRQPAHDLDAERAVLAAVLLDAPGGAAHDRVADILAADGSDFYAAPMARAWRALAELASRNLPHDLVAVAGHLRDDGAVTASSYLADVCNATPAASARLEQLARRVRDKRRVRDLAATAQRVSAECYGPTGDGPDDVQAFLDGAEESVAAVARAPELASLITLRASLTSTFRALALAAQSGSRLLGVPTGFAELDDLLGGLRDSELTILAGRPGMGKTALAMAIALNVAYGPAELPPDAPRNGVLFFTLEMQHEQLSLRTICTEAEVDSRAARSGRLTPLDWQRLTDQANALAALPIWFDDRSSPTPYEIRSKARRVAVDCARQRPATRLAAVVVDYLQIVDAASCLSPHTKREEQVAFVARSLKALAKDLRVPVIACAQLSRDSAKAKDKRPTLTDLRESGAIEQEADAVIFVHREEYYLREKTPDADRGVAELIVAKQRNGPTGTARTCFYPRYSLFRDGGV